MVGQGGRGYWTVNNTSFITVLAQKLQVLAEFCLVLSKLLKQ